MKVFVLLLVILVESYSFVHGFLRLEPLILKLNVRKFKFSCTDGKIPATQGSIGRLNEKLLNEARKLRNEAEILESQDRTFVNATSEAAISNIRSEFVVDKPMIVQKISGGFNVSTKLNTSDSANYRSILTSGDEASARKNLADKLSGEAPLFVRDIQNNFDDSTELDSRSSFRKGYRAYIDTEIRSRKPWTQTSSVDELYGSMEPWITRQGVKVVVSAFMLGFDRKSFDSIGETAILEYAIAFTAYGLQGYAADSKDLLPDGNQVSFIFDEVFYRADVLRYRKTGLVPSIDELQNTLLDSPGAALDASILTDLMIQWKSATLKRLTSENPEDRADRQQIWGRGPIQQQEKVERKQGSMNGEIEKSRAAIEEALKALEQFRKDGSMSPLLMSLSQTLNSTFSQLNGSKSLFEDNQSSPVSSSLLPQSPDSILLANRLNIFGSLMNMPSSDENSTTQAFNSPSDQLNFMESIGAVVEADSWKNTAERIVGEVYPVQSRKSDAVISREGKIFRFYFLLLFN